jgi:hypothetical protein
MADTYDKFSNQGEPGGYGPTEQKRCRAGEDYTISKMENIYSRSLSLIVGGR